MSFLKSGPAAAAAEARLETAPEAPILKMFERAARVQAGIAMPVDQQAPSEVRAVWVYRPFVSVG